MKVIEKTVKLSEAIILFDIIEQVLREQKNTQVFVAYALYWELNHNGSKNHVFPENFPSSLHYCDNEKCLIHKASDINSETIHKASFINNCADYLQLVQFQAGVFCYTHFEQCFKQLLIIEVEQ